MQFDPNSPFKSSGTTPHVAAPSFYDGTKRQRLPSSDHVSSQFVDAAWDQPSSSSTMRHMTAMTLSTLPSVKVPFPPLSDDEDSDGSLFDGISSDDETTALDNRTIVKYPDGSCYSGEHDGNNVPHGKGLMTWPDDSYYSGGWCMGQRHGVGTMSWASAKKSYHGSFKMGALHGSGKMYDEKHQLLVQGLWLNNVHVQAS